MVRLPASMCSRISALILGCTSFCRIRSPLGNVSRSAGTEKATSMGDRPLDLASTQPARNGTEPAKGRVFPPESPRSEIQRQCSCRSSLLGRHQPLREDKINLSSDCPMSIGACTLSGSLTPSVKSYHVLFTLS